MTSMYDLNMLKEFAQQMDWEGGWDGITRHGHNGSGDNKLDDLLEKFEAALSALDDHWDHLNKLYDLSPDEENED